MIGRPASSAIGFTYGVAAFHGARLKHGARSVFNGGNPAPVSERRVRMGTGRPQLVSGHVRIVSKVSKTCGPDALLFLLHATC
jgi:hypothetical protein